MKEHLTTQERRKIDRVHNLSKAVSDRKLFADGFLIEDFQRKVDGLPPLSSERDRSHFLNVHGEVTQYYLDHGISAMDLGLWTQAVFQWIKQQSEVPDLQGRVTDCEVGPPKTHGW